MIQTVLSLSLVLLNIATPLVCCAQDSEEAPVIEVESTDDGNNVVSFDEVNNTITYNQEETNSDDSNDEDTIVEDVDSSESETNEDALDSEDMSNEQESLDEIIDEEQSAETEAEAEDVIASDKIDEIISELECVEELDEYESVLLGYLIDFKAQVEAVESAKLALEEAELVVEEISVPECNDSQMYDFLMDPQMLISATDGAMYSGEKFEHNSSLYFENAGGEYDFSHISDKLNISSASNIPVRVKIHLEVSGLKQLSTFQTKDFGDSNRAGIYLALIDGEGNEYPVDDAGISEVEYILQPVSDDVESNDYSFAITGSCNFCDAWKGVTDKPSITVYWETESILDDEERLANIEEKKLALEEAERILEELRIRIEECQNASEELKEAIKVIKEKANSLPDIEATEENPDDGLDIEENNDIHSEDNADIIDDSEDEMPQDDLPIVGPSDDDNDGSIIEESDNDVTDDQNNTEPNDEAGGFVQDNGGGENGMPEAGGEGSVSEPCARDDIPVELE